MTVHVPDRFTDQIVRHAISVNAIDRYPLILAVQGPPGDGKSFQVAHSLAQHKFTMLRLSASLLAGTYESEPIEAAKRIYKKADEFAKSNPLHKPAIVFEDFDLSPASRSADTSYTVNSQLLNGFLMNLADDVSSCDVGTTRRYPVFLTGNDFSSLYGPLSRSGRCNFFTWEPNAEELTKIVYHVLYEYGITASHAEVRWLTRRHRRAPISSYVAALDEWAGHVAYDHYKTTGHLEPRQIRSAIRERAPSIEGIDELMCSQESKSRQPGRFSLRGTP